MFAGGMALRAANWAWACVSACYGVLTDVSPVGCTNNVQGAKQPHSTSGFNAFPQRSGRSSTLTSLRASLTLRASQQQSPDGSPPGGHGGSVRSSRELQHTETGKSVFPMPAPDYTHFTTRKAMRVSRPCV